MPQNALKEEVLKWKKHKNTAEWQYAKLTSDSAEVFHENEKARVKRSRDQQRQAIIDAAQGESELYVHVPESPRTRKREKSRAR